MIEILAQITKDGMLDPQTVHDIEQLMGEYCINQIVKVRVSGAEKERSIPENNLYHACLKVVSDNFSGPADELSMMYNTPEKVKIQTKINCGFIEGFVTTGNNVQAILKSLDFRKSKQHESHQFIKEAIRYMAMDVLGLSSANELVAIAKSRMYRSI